MIEPTIAQLIVAALGMVGVILAATLPVMISTRRKVTVAADAADAAAASAKAAATQTVHAVTNGHPEHLRDALDRQHAEVQAVLHGLTEQVVHVRRDQDGMKSDIRGLRRDYGRLADWREKADDRIRDLEDTQPHPRAGVPKSKEKQ